MHLTRDGGQSFEMVGFDDRWVWEATFGPDRTLYVGTEPPMLFASRDGGDTWDGLDGALPKVWRLYAASP